MSAANSAGSGTRVNKPILFMGLLVVLPLLYFLYSGFGKDPNAIPSELIGRTAPPFTLVDLDGKTWTIDQLRGKPVVLNFWATWCGPCKMEHPMLQAAAQGYGDQVQFLGVIYNDNEPGARAYLRSAGAAYPNLFDVGDRVSIDYGVTGVPETYFIDKQGQVVFKQPGPVYPDLLRGQINAMLSKP